MAEFAYKLSNGKELVLNGDSAPTDDEVDAIAKERGLTLLPAASTPEAIAPIEAAPVPFDPKIEMRRKLGYGRQDEQIFDLDKFTEGTNKWTNNISNAIGQSDWIPEIAKGTLATGAALGPEMLNVIASALSDPTLAAGSSTVLRSITNPKTKLPISDILSSGPQVPLEAILPQQKLLPKFAESLVPEPGFISGEAGTAINKTYPYDMGPSVPDISHSHMGTLEENPIGGTVLPQELGEVVQTDPALRASGIIPAKPVNQINKMLEGLGIKDPDAVAESMGLVTKPSDVYLGTGHARPGKTNLPSNPSSIIKAKIKAKAVETLASNGVEPVLASTVVDVADKIPALAPVVSDPNFIKKYLTAFSNRETPGSRITAGVGSSIDTELVNQHPRLGELVKQTQADSHIKAGGWIADYDGIVEPLTDKQFDNLVSVIEGKAKPLDDDVAMAAGRYKTLDNQISQEATATGMGLKSDDGLKMVPWTGKDNYWPHLYTEEFFQSLKNNPKELRANLIKAGKSPAEIDGLLSNSKKYGERLIDAQHAREADLPGYRVDKNVYRQHIADMSKRITEAKNYGAMDLADSASPVMDLIRQSKNPEYSTKLMSKLLGRDGIGNRDSIEMSRKIVGAQAWLHLTTAGISNLSSFAMTPLQTSVKSFVGGLADSIFMAKQSGEFAKRSGAIQNIFKEIFAASMDDTTKFMPTKVYGIDAGEKWMRTVSANAGKRYATELFQEMKDGNANPNNLKKLQELTLTSPADLALQTELNSQQVKRAAFRTGELSQGLAEMQNLPEHWTGSGIANILTLFHKYQFAQTKIVKDLLTSGSVKQNLRNASMLLAASQVAGEITGDAKAAVRGTIRAGYSQDENAIYEEIANRGDFAARKFGLEDSPNLARFVENTFQSFALGMYADLAEGFSGGGMDVLKQMAGSTINDLMKVIDIGKEVATGDLEGAATKGTSMIPLVGPPIAAEMREEATAR